jgi:hypothetical protein
MPDITRASGINGRTQAGYFTDRMYVTISLASSNEMPGAGHTNIAPVTASACDNFLASFSVSAAAVYFFAISANAGPTIFWCSLWQVVQSLPAIKLAPLLVACCRLGAGFYLQYPAQLSS